MPKLAWFLADKSKTGLDKLKRLLLQLYLVQCKLIFSAATAEFCDHSTDDCSECCWLKTVNKMNGVSNNVFLQKLGHLDFRNYFENLKKKNPAAQEEITVKPKDIRYHISVEWFFSETQWQEREIILRQRQKILTDFKGSYMFHKPLKTDLLFLK